MISMILVTDRPGSNRNGPQPKYTKQTRCLAYVIPSQKTVYGLQQTFCQPVDNADDHLSVLSLITHQPTAS